MLSLQLTVNLIFLAWGLSLLVEAQECPELVIPDETMWLNTKNGKIRCLEGYRTMAQTSCLNGKWKITPVCTKYSECAKSECLNNGTRVNGTCVCLPGYYGKTCKACSLMKGVYMRYPNAKIGSFLNISTKECKQKCAERPDCNFAFSYPSKPCMLYRYPVVGVEVLSDEDECIRHCYSHRQCTGVNFCDRSPKKCVLLGTISGLEYTLVENITISTTGRACEDMFLENR